MPLLYRLHVHNMQPEFGLYFTLDPFILAAPPAPTSLSAMHVIELSAELSARYIQEQPGRRAVNVHFSGGGYGGGANGVICHLFVDSYRK